jgi:hypothetical protein
MDSFDNINLEKLDDFLNEHGDVSSKRRMIRGKVPAIGLSRTARAVRAQKIFGPKPRTQIAQPQGKRRKWLSTVVSILKKVGRKK